MIIPNLKPLYQELSIIPGRKTRNIICFRVKSKIKMYNAAEIITTPRDRK